MTKAAWMFPWITEGTGHPKHLYLARVGYVAICLLAVVDMFFFLLLPAFIVCKLQLDRYFSSLEALLGIFALGFLVLSGLTKFTSLAVVLLPMGQQSTADYYALLRCCIGAAIITMMFWLTVMRGRD